jgi:hypothetical protein
MELETYMDEYNGFHYYMKLLEAMAKGIRDGILKPPSK